MVAGVSVDPIRPRGAGGQSRLRPARDHGTGIPIYPIRALTVQPAASAGATLRVIMENGKFQGVMAATTPTGCLSTTKRRSGSTDDSTSPSTRFASSANHSIDAALQW
jgi:hypothetical protein